MSRPKLSNHKQEVQAVYNRYETAISEETSFPLLLELCVTLHREINRLNTAYGLWDDSKGYDHDGIYFVASYVVNHNQHPALTVLSPDLDFRKKKLASLIFEHFDRSEKLQIAIIEPHPDDALGSASGLCYASEILTTLHTLAAVPDARDFVRLDSQSIDRYESVKKKPNIERHIRYHLPDLHWDCRVQGTVTDYGAVAEQYARLSTSYEQFKAEIERIVAQASETGGYLAFPLGIEHPMHILTAYAGISCIRELGFDTARVIVYVDHPYDFQNVGTNRLCLARSYWEEQLDINLCRCDDLSVDQSLLRRPMIEIYGDRHYGEFDGSLERSMCSYFIRQDAVETISRFVPLHINNILYLTAQAKPFLKTGGLGEVAYQYGRAASSYVNDIRIMMPKYGNSGEYGTLLGENITFTYECPDRTIGDVDCEIETREYHGLIYYLVDLAGCFDNQSARNAGSQGIIFAMFSDAILQKALNCIDFKPTVLHCNDWQTALIPFLKKTKYNYYRPDLKTLYTIHFFGYKGIFSKKEILRTVGMGKSGCQLCLSCGENCVLDRINLLSAQDQSKLQVPPNQMSFMNTGIEFADVVSTVSKGYARELQSYPVFSSVNVVGVRNGVTDRRYVFTPESGFVDFDANNFVPCKKKNKAALQKRLGLTVDASVPLLCMVSRLTVVKGLDSIKNIAREILALGVQLVLVGDDEDQKTAPYQVFFRALELEVPGNLACCSFDEELEFETYAASDILLMPSLSEACGTTQTNGMMYGVIPIVTMIPGFEDTILDFNARQDKGNPKNWGKGIGFYAYRDDCWVLLEVIKKAVTVYKNSPSDWEGIARSCIQTDFGWKSGSLFEYAKLYDGLASDSAHRVRTSC